MSQPLVTPEVIQLLKCDRCDIAFISPDALEKHGNKHENGFVDAPHGESPR